MADRESERDTGRRLQIHKGFVMNARRNNKTKTLKREKTCFCVKQLVQRHYGGSGRTKSTTRQGFSPTQTHKEHLTLVSLGKTPETPHSTPVSSASTALSVPTLFISSISHALCSVHHPILLFLSLFWGLFVPLSPFLPASMASDRTDYCQHQRCVYIKGFSGGLTLVLAKLD